MKKSVIYLTCLAASFSQILHAEPYDMSSYLKLSIENDELKSEIVELKEKISRSKEEKEAKINDFNAQISQQERQIKSLQHNQTSCEIMQPKFDPCAPVFNYRLNPNQWSLTARGEFLYWKTRLDGTEYAIQGQPPGGDVISSDSTLIGNVQFTRYDYDPGFRVALRGRFPPNFWGIETQYTYFHNEGSDSATGPRTTNEGNMLVPTFYLAVSSGNESPQYRATSSLDLNYHLLNVTLDREFLFEDHLFFSLFVGPSGVWIDQDWKVDYFSVESNTDINSDWRYQAGGLRFGTQGEWYIGAGFSLVSQLSFAGYIGSYEKHQKTSQRFLDPVREADVVDFHIDETRFAYNTQLMIGPKWGMAFNGWAFAVSAGYEIAPWFNLYQVDSSTEISNVNSRIYFSSKGVLAPQGLTVRANITF